MSEGIYVIVQDYGALAAGISATITSIWLLFRKVIVPMINTFQKFEYIYDKVQQISSEVTVNNGKSLKDLIKKIDRGLLRLNERQKAWLADAEKALFETDAEGNCIWINRTYTRLVERNPDEILGKGWVNCIAEEDREKVEQEWYRAVKEDRELTLTCKMETPKGEKKLIRARSYKMVDSTTGEVIGYLGTIKLRDNQ